MKIDDTGRKNCTQEIDSPGHWVHDEQVRRLAQDPAALRELAPVIAGMARLAQAVGATPAAAL